MLYHTNCAKLYPIVPRMESRARHRVSTLFPLTRELAMIVTPSVFQTAERIANREAMAVDMS
jgi:hypothetical protein